ncbi:MAG: DNA-processing protein DprA [Zoogloeaceae bacterium]|jgi:DNA processing protein|nr:DNA-processing protein DprA [Zoogloeaceae bacterium]
MPSAIPDDDLSFWLRLTQIPGLGGVSQRKLLAAFGSPEAALSASASAIEPVLGNQSRAFLSGRDTPELAQKVEAALAWADKPGCRLLTLADPDYPPALFDAPDPPTLLYARGDLSALARQAIAVVGSRNATAQGLKTAHDFSQALARAGFSVVSGLALGIDAAAHTGALDGQGQTVAVIGTGADRLYPASNRALAERLLAEGGLILSDFPLGTPALAANFPRRNRIIAGLARGVLVIEAAVASGSLITARLAGDAGRDVFAIPGSIHSPLSKGCHKLIRQGAKLTECIEDILEELRPAAPLMPLFTAPAEPPPPPPTDTPEGRLLRALGHDPVALDDLACRLALPAEQLLPLLMEMELMGQVAKLPGDVYQRVC